MEVLSRAMNYGCTHTSPLATSGENMHLSFTTLFFTLKRTQLQCYPKKIASDFTRLLNHIHLRVPSQEKILVLPCLFFIKARKAIKLVFYFNIFETIFERLDSQCSHCNTN